MNRISVQVKAIVGADGVLRLEVPTAFRDTEVDACVVIQPSETDAWPTDFFETTAGKWMGELERGEQGTAEQRDWPE